MTKCESSFTFPPSASDTHALTSTSTRGFLVLRQRGRYPDICQDDWIWRTLDGVAIPMSQGLGGLWISERPNGGNNLNCLWMWESNDSRFNDTECDKSDVRVICEME
ncbi:hypothetical protein MAR_035108 [Mya arenaria]|uniref:C-type lectin domain-containing protein n=1 Tax=Mya arenaria TaxID=6604 RepID=A0ABY7EM29_MYAAR|nr:hypothetical protein MAR_035108 [Mya arenaria]